MMMMMTMKMMIVVVSVVVVVGLLFNANIPMYPTSRDHLT
jgi:hypothetical protein